MKLPFPRPVLAVVAAAGVAALFGLPCHMVGATNFGIVIGTLGGFLAGWIVWIRDQGSESARVYLV